MNNFPIEISLSGGPSESVGSVGEGNNAERSHSMSRGRPRGSRNRPNRERTTLTSVVLTIPPGVDLINWVTGYSVSNSVCVNVLRGFGTISQVSLTHLRSQNPPHQLTEVLNLISISGACFYPLARCTVFHTMLQRMSGAVISGTAVRMTTLDPVVLNVIVFRNPFIVEAPLA